MNVICTTKVRHLRYESLRRSLEQVVLVWPHRYEHKIIGKNGPEFLGALAEFETAFPSLVQKQKTASKKGSYLSLTYECHAKDVDEIISLWVASEQLKDLISVL